jgi:ABC-type phosphate/phosphonate transport system substrate-binding protein
MKILSILILACLVTACGNSSSSQQSAEDKKKMVVKGCMRSAGVDVNQPNDNVSPAQLAEIEKCLSNFGYKF